MTPADTGSLGKVISVGESRGIILGIRCCCTKSAMQKLKKL